MKEWEVRIAWAVLVVTLVAWPVTVILTNEPPFILSLSWVALTLTAVDYIKTSRVHRDQKE